MKKMTFLMEMRQSMNIKRFQNKFRLSKTNITDHEWSSTRIAFWLAKIDEDYNGVKNIDYRYLLSRALHHDSPKCYAGDIQSNEGNSELVKYTKKFIFPQIFKDNIEPLIPNEFVSEYKKLMIEPTEYGYEDCLIYVANKIDKILEAEQEIQLNNKVPFEKIRENQIKELLRFLQDKENEFPLNSCKIVLASMGKDLYLKPGFCGEFFKIRYHEDYSYVLATYFKNYMLWGRDLIHTDRYQNLTKLIPRYVASHEWSVARISFFIALNIEHDEGIKIDYTKLLFTAIEHDAIESTTGDFLSHVKKMTPEMEELINESEEKAFEIVAKNMLPLNWYSQFKDALLDPKSNSIEGEIIKIADAIDVIFECIEELQVGNKGIFLKILNEKVSYLRGFNYKVVQVLCDEFMDLKYDV